MVWYQRACCLMVALVEKALKCVRGLGSGGLEMDPLTVGAVLLAIVSGAGGELGSKLWTGVSALVRRPFHPRHPAEDAAALMPSGEPELEALERAPADEGRAVALAEALVARAGADAEFRQALEGWWEQASPLRTGEGNVTNTISGGTQHGPVLQGRDFTGMTFGAAPAVPPPVPPSPSNSV